jgi:glycerol-3-phosphate dehydrogenase
LFLYEKLAGVKGGERFSMLNRKQVLQIQPGLNPEGLQGAALYSEYQADDSRLTIGLIKTAVAYGAECLNYCKAIQITEKKGKAAGAIVEDLLSGESIEIKSKVVVAAAGPWTDEIRKMESSESENKLLLSKGIHLVFSQEKLPVSNPVYTDDREKQRMYFLIPNRGKVYVGTTDTLSSDAIDNPILEYKDIDYLLDAVNNTFPNIRLTSNDIESSWVGIRPLIRKGNKGPSEISRKDEIIHSDSGLLSIAGGKLTGYRIMAKKVTNLVIKRLGMKTTCKTKWIQFADNPETDDLEKYIALRKGEASQVGFDFIDIKRLVETYGKGCEWIINCAFELYHKYPNSEQLKIAAECHYAVKFEFVCSVSDFLIRRTGHLYYNHNYAIAHLDFVADVIQELLNQSDIERKEGVGYFESASQQALPSL